MVLCEHTVNLGYNELHSHTKNVHYNQSSLQIETAITFTELMPNRLGVTLTKSTGLPHFVWTLLGSQQCFPRSPGCPCGMHEVPSRARIVEVKLRSLVHVPW